MSVTGKRTIGIAFTGDVEAPNLAYQAADNVASPGVIELKSLTTGTTTITPPVGFKAVTIVPPAGNTILMTLKGVTGDTGIPMHKTDPTSVGLDTTTTTFCITVASSVAGIRFIWS